MFCSIPDSFVQASQSSDRPLLPELIETSQKKAAMLAHARMRTEDVCPPTNARPRVIARDTCAAGNFSKKGK
jgi:hypothetical protein